MSATKKIQFTMSAEVYGMLEKMQKSPEYFQFSDKQVICALIARAAAHDVKPVKEVKLPPTKEEKRAEEIAAYKQKAVENWRMSDIWPSPHGYRDGKKYWNNPLFSPDGTFVRMGETWGIEDYLPEDYPGEHHKPYDDFPERLARELDAMAGTTKNTLDFHWPEESEFMDEDNNVDEAALEAARAAVMKNTFTQSKGD